MKPKTWILSGTEILRELEESANKKLNIHSNSLDNIDWIACYEKLHKNTVKNIPKDNTGRLTSNGIRTSHILIPDNSLPKPLGSLKSGLTKTRTKLKKSTNLPKERQKTSMGKIESSIGEGTQKPFMIVHQRKGQSIKKHH